eukprot:1145080-Pelagomonas_calceolata.AAC.5
MLKRGVAVDLLRDDDHHQQAQAHEPRALAVKPPLNAPSGNTCARLRSGCAVKMSEIKLLGLTWATWAHGQSLGALPRCQKPSF